MTGSISSEQRQELIAGYVLGDLSLDEAAILEQLIAADPAIAQEIEQMQAALEVAYVPPEVQPPAHLRASLLNAHQAAHRPDSPSPVKATPPPAFPAARSSWRWNWRTGLGAAAALVIVGLGISNYVLWRSLQATQAQRPSADTFTVALQPTQANSSASVSVVIDPTQLTATLRAENLPPLSDGQVYALWTVLEPGAPFTVDAKDAILTDVFTVDEAGGGAEDILLPGVYRDRQWIKAIAVTVEAMDAPQRHLSSPILIEML